LESVTKGGIWQEGRRVWQEECRPPRRVESARKVEVRKEGWISARRVKSGRKDKVRHEGRSLAGRPEFGIKGGI
jgi:hypothetical protein